MALRVLWVIKGLGPGGSEQLLVAAARAHDPQEFVIECAYLVPWKDHLVEALERAGVRVHCLAPSAGNGSWPLNLRRLIAMNDFDVVHVHSPLPGAVARLAVLATGARHRPALVTTEHNGWATYHGLTRWANRLTSRWDQSVIAVSDEVRASMRGAGAAHSETLIHGIDVVAVAAHRAGRIEARAELGIGSGQLVVGTVANFREQKDYPNLIRAVRLLVEHSVDVRVVAIGQGPLEPEMRRLIDRMGLGSHVILTGFRADAQRLMAAFDVFTLASKWEGLPVALMEALALGLPIVATSAGGVGELLTDGVDALLVPPGNSVALADGLQRVLADDDLRVRLARAATARAAEFDVNRAVRRLEEIYRSVSRSRQPLQGATARPPAPAHRLPQGLDIRAATRADRAAILELCALSLGWTGDDRFAELYAWKHDLNVFGPSPTWVATDGGRIVGLRAFMRWEFVRGGEIVKAVRAVDTATDPDHRGKGLFTALTLHAVDSLHEEGVDFVFNTPNRASLTGYLKMGWREVGRLPVASRVSSPGPVLRTALSRAAADLWSLPINAGEPFLDWLDRAGLPSAPRDDPTLVRALTTNVSAEYLRWRYGLPDLNYRAVAGDGGVVVLRRRRRGSAIELAVLDHLGLDAAGADRVVAATLRSADCHHALRLGAARLSTGFVPLPGAGPMVTWRALNQLAMPPLHNWRLGLGDIELF